MIAESSDIIVKQFELCTTGGASTLHPVGATEQVIGDLSRDRSAGIADHHHLAGHDLFTIDETGIVGRSFSTPATRLDLNLRAPVGQLHEPRRTGEHYALKSGEQTKGVDVDPDLVDHSGELLALERLVELSFVANHGTDMTQRLSPLADELEKVCARFDELCLSRNTKAARYPTLTAVKACHQDGGEPAGPQIVMDLQRLGGLP